VSRFVVIASADAACWSPRAAAAWALDMLMGPFAAKAEAGSNAVITMQMTKRMEQLRFRFSHQRTRGCFGCNTRAIDSSAVVPQAWLRAHPPLHKFAHLLECLPALGQFRVPHRPGMDHVRPDLQRDVHIGEAKSARKADGVVEQRLR